MRRSKPRNTLREMNVSALEAFTLPAGALLILAAVAAAFLNEDPGGLARALGTAGFAVLGISATSFAVRLYRAGVAASLPASVARVQVRVRPARGFNTVTVALALVLPLAATAAPLVLLEWGWLPLAGVVLLGCAVVVATSMGRVLRDWS
jgi:hypothetical protein